MFIFIFLPLEQVSQAKTGKRHEKRVTVLPLLTQSLPILVFILSDQQALPGETLLGAYINRLQNTKWVRGLGKKRGEGDKVK